MNAFDPDDESLWRLGSDVNWVKGSWVSDMDSPGVFARRHPWIVANRLFAETMVRNNPQAVLNILGALFSWRVCTVDQLRDGLAVGDVPGFDRDEPNLYGALCRLGAISVGFDKREHWEDVRLPYTWLTVSDSSRRVREVVNLIDRRQTLKRTLTSGMFQAMRVHARHNTFASHVGVTLVHDDRVRFAGGDAWGAFRSIDAQAVAEVGLNRISSTDVVTLLDNNVLAGIEVQAGTHNLDAKIRNWSRLLAYSPMRRRGLLCVWLFIKGATTGAYTPFAKTFEESRGLTEMMVGDPSVAQRMGYTTWDDWYAHGHPSESFGCYTDMLGTKRSVFDDAWRACTPTPRPLSAVDEWGWQVMRDDIRREFGWDASSWRMPDQYRGGFFGFAKGGAADDGR